jgi:hypothetical protein
MAMGVWEGGGFSLHGSQDTEKKERKMEWSWAIQSSKSYFL